MWGLVHDGTQQQLVSLALDLRAAEATVPTEPAELRAQLTLAATELAGATADLQEISRGIHPAIEGGLLGLIDRVEALRGTFSVTSPSGQGTTLLVELPVTSR